MCPVRASSFTRKISVRLGSIVVCHAPAVTGKLGDVVPPSRNTSPKASYFSANTDCRLVPPINRDQSMEDASGLSRVNQAVCRNKISGRLSGSPAGSEAGKSAGNVSPAPVNLH